MREVSKEEFYNGIGSQDACVRVENEYKWPYTVLFELRHSKKLIGKVVDSYTDGNKYPIVSTYYLV